MNLCTLFKTVMARMVDCRLTFLLIPIVLLQGAYAQIQISYDAGGNPIGVFQASIAPSAFFEIQNKTICNGDPISFSVAQNGTGPFTFQWKKNGVAIAGATDATYFKAVSDANDSGAYSVVITGAAGSVTYNPGSLSVLATTKDLYGVSYGSSKFVSVGQAGTIVRSSDLSNWAVSTSGTTNDLNGLIFNSALFVAVGNAGVILTSADGITWTSRTSGTGNNLRGVTYGNSTYVAVGANGTILTSSDSITWTLRASDPTQTLEGVVYGNGIFVAVGSNGAIWTSTTGVSWSSHSIASTGTLNSVAFGGSRFVAVGTSGLIVTSTDGALWTTATTPWSQTLEAITYVSNVFFAIGPQNVLRTSINGSTWASSSTGSFDELSGLFWGNSKLVAAGKHGTIAQLPAFALHHFDVGSISDQRAGNGFNVAITPKDISGNTVSASANVSLSAFSNVSFPSQNIFSIPSTSFAGSTTNAGNGVYMGNIFTPDKDLIVTGFRTSFGTTAALFTGDAEVLYEVAITGTPGTWTTTPLTSPIQLKAGQNYILASRTTGTFYYYTNVFSPSTFSDGVLNQSMGMVSTTTNLQVGTANYRWVMVDMAYSALRPQTLPITPTSYNINGTSASIPVTIATASTNVSIQIADAAGHSGQSGLFNVNAGGDIGITMLDSPDPVDVNGTLTYTLKVSNAGTAQSTAVTVTDTLPQGVTLLATTPSTSQTNNGVVVFSLGNLSGMTTSTLTIQVRPNSSGVMLTNSATVTRLETDGNPINNAATTTTYVPPTVSLQTAIFNEGNLPVHYVQVNASLSSVSPFTVSCDVTSIDGTAIVGADYGPVAEHLIFGPGQTTASFWVLLTGDIVKENDETFTLRLQNALNASIPVSDFPVTILNDDEIPNSVQYLQWGTISDPKKDNTAFSATLTAKDYASTTVTSFSGPVNWYWLLLDSAVTNRINTNITYSASGTGSFTLGYEFVPTNNIFVTHVRSFAGASKISIWSGSGGLLTSITAPAGRSFSSWRELALPAPLFLRGNAQYRISYSVSQTYFTGNTPLTTFADGFITDSYYAAGDAFPTIVDNSMWHFVDLRYVKAQLQGITGSFASGVNNSSYTLVGSGLSRLFAEDGNGHSGMSDPFWLGSANDLAVRIITTNMPLCGANFTYQVEVLNPGSANSTSVKLTNTLPVNATLISATTSPSVAITTNGNVLTCNFGTLGSLAAGTMTITVMPNIAGVTLTDTAGAGRTETDSNTANNTATSILSVSTVLAEGLQEATDNYDLSWQSGGNQIWALQTTTTHDGNDAIKSGAIQNSQSSWAQTVVRGPGILSFFWKVSSQVTADYMNYLTNNVERNRISGEAGWSQVTLSVPPGLLTNRWQYQKDSSINAGSDSAWLDQVTYTVPIFYFTNSVVANNILTLKVFGVEGQHLIIEKSSDLLSWSSIFTNDIPSNGLSINSVSIVGNPFQFYRAVQKNE
jgi:uncharacterized repeat protein (TIGR01451 family)